MFILRNKFHFSDIHRSMNAISEVPSGVTYLTVARDPLQAIYLSKFLYRTVSQAESNDELRRMLSAINKQQLRRGQLGLKGLAKIDSYCSDKIIFVLSDRNIVSNRNIYAI